MSVSKHIKEHSMLGIYGRSSEVLTVGSAGRFSTIQAAIDYIEAQPAFIPITVTSGGAVTSWTQGASTFVLSTAAQTAVGQLLTPVPTEKMWFLVEDDSYYYPLEDISNAAVGAGFQSFKTLRRIEADVTVSKNITLYRQNDFVIELLDGRYDESFELSTPCFITFKGTGKNVLNFTATQGAGFVSGKLQFVDIIASAQDANGAINWTIENTIGLEFANMSVSSIQDDFIFPNTYLGSIRAENITVIQQPTAAQGHCIAPRKVYGDIIMNDIVWLSVGHTGAGVVPSNTLSLVDVSEDARTTIINGVYGFIRNAFDDFTHVSVIGTTARNNNNPVYLNDCHLIVNDTCTADLSMARIAPTSNGSAYYIDNCGIIAPNCSGAIRLVEAGGNPAGACTVEIGRGNTVLDCETQANITYTVKAAQAAGTATVASGTTTINVTHGLGYTPRVEDINVVPTLLSNSAKFWITAVGATTFTINVDADPGAGTATFAWRIGQ